MKTPFSPLQEVNLAAKLADLQEISYQNMIAIQAIVELLEQKGLLTREELAGKTYQLDEQMNQLIIRAVRRSGDRSLPLTPPPIS